MGQTIEQGGRHLGVAEDGCPFAEAEIGGDHHAGPLVELAQQVEEQRTAGRVKGRYPSSPGTADRGEPASRRSGLPCLWPSPVREH